MKILFCSYAFSPSVGGIETASEMLATAFAKAGCDVVVVTETPGDDAKERPFRVVRQIGWQELWRLTRWADVVFQNNLSIRLLWPALLQGRPRFVTTQTWLAGVRDRETLASRVKRAILGRCQNVAISEAIAQHVRHPSEVLGNPFDAAVFSQSPQTERPGEVLFVGRLVSDKGLDLLLQALAMTTTAKLTVAGDGPERAPCEALANALGLRERVTFAGVVRGPALAALMRAHRVLVVPSRWAEPFGIVALEGIACGSVVVGSADGGLSEAIGPCGIIFPNGDVNALAAALKRALHGGPEIEAMRAAAAAHLARFQIETVCAAYLALFAR